jgi:adenosine deaminase
MLLQAELHLHIEGTFEPEQMFEIAARNNVLGSLPFNDLAAAKLAYKFEDLQSFLNIYYAGCAVLLHEKVWTPLLSQHPVQTPSNQCDQPARPLKPSLKGRQPVSRRYEP